MDIKKLKYGKNNTLRLIALFIMVFIIAGVSSYRLIISILRKEKIGPQLPD
jgi:hypothetical protein